MPERLKGGRGGQVIQPCDLVAQILVLGPQSSAGNFRLFELAPQFGDL